MAKGVYAALSGAVAAETALDTTAQNLANASSDGYQRLRPVFREALSRAEPSQAPGSNRYTVVSSTAIDMTPGAIRSTGRGLDVALPEGAFLAVSTDRGERYTRAGSIQVAPGGRLELAGAALADDAGQPLTVAEDAVITVSSDGQVLANGEAAGRLRLVRFADPSALAPEGALLFAPTAASGTPEATDAALTVGALGASNAEAVGSMTEIIKTTRLFDTYQRAIDAFFDLDRRIASVAGQ